MSDSQLFMCLDTATNTVSSARSKLSTEIVSTPVLSGVSWNNFLNIKGAWGAFDDVQKARALYERAGLIKYISRGTYNPVKGFSKNTYKEMIKANKAQNLLNVVISAVDTDLGKYVIESTPEAMRAAQAIANSSSSDWIDLKDKVLEGLDRLAKDPATRSALWEELNKPGNEILEPFRLISKSVLQGSLNLLNSTFNPGIGVDPKDVMGLDVR